MRRAFTSRLRRLRDRVFGLKMERNVRHILETIHRRGGEAYLVGGCVRDRLLGLVPNDYDVVTDLAPDKIESLFKNSKAVGKSFGVVLVGDVEVATFRKDVYNPEGSMEGVVFVPSLREDVARRDFTVNSMAMDTTGKVIDFFGGREDLRDGMLRCVGDPVKRIAEDPVRILRGLRFAARFGFFLDPATRRAMLSERMKVTHVPRERIRLELLKVLKECDKPSAFFDLLRELRLLRFVFPSLSETVGKRGGNHHAESVYDHCVMAADHLPKEKPLLRLAGLLHDVGKPRTSRVDEHSGISFHAHESVGADMAGDDLGFLRFSSKEIEYVTGLVRFHMWNFEEDSKVNTYRRWMSKLARHGIDVQDLLDLRIADRKANLKKAGKPVKTYEFRRTIKMIEKVIEEDSALKLSDMEFNGHDLIAMGLKPSPKFGVILNTLFERILDDPKLNTREKLKELAREMI